MKTLLKVNRFMAPDDVRQKLIDIFCQVFDLDSLDLADGMTANDIEDWDSLSNIRLMVSVEKSFGVRFTAAEIESLKNVGDLIKSIQSKMPL